MKEYEPTGSLFCYWSNLKEHPKCTHGPTLLFGRENADGDVNKFYACSACRDRKLCSFYVEQGKEPRKHQKQTWEQERKKSVTFYNHQKLFILYNQLMSENSANRAYCHTCEKLFAITEKYKHNDHNVMENISDHQMSHPTQILKPLENSKKEAQYLFSQKAVKDIMNMLINLNAKNVLCIGAPRIHEYITNNMECKMSSLLLDFDGRFHNFFGPLNYCWYNLFNHHFFQENSQKVFKEFLTQNKGKDMYMICDPPFGGRVEPISQTIKTISDLHKKLNKITNSEDELKIFFIFPYFMEAIIKEKSNPPNINGSLKDLRMTDYKVEYDNHPLFVLKANNQQQGSQVRIFTNVSLNLLKLPESDGYKYCKRCQKWVASENKHCKICRSCTSKDGRRYRHCKVCQRCVKPKWVHCKTCDRCSLPSHTCGRKPKIGSCFKCKEIGHTEKECPGETLKKSTLKLKAKKQQNKLKDNHSFIKKQKLESLSIDSNLEKGKKDRKKLKIKKLTVEKINEKAATKISAIVKLNKKKEKISKIQKVSVMNSDVKENSQKGTAGLGSNVNKTKSNVQLNKKKKMMLKIVAPTIEKSDLPDYNKKSKKVLKNKINKCIS